MKLYELTGIKKINSLSVSDLIMYFIDNSNYLFAGNGAQAYVFIHPNNKEVIKFWMFDSAYEAFIKYAKQHQSNQFIPKIIKGINELKFKNHTIKYVRIEKLKELQNSSIIFGVEFKKLINAIDKHIEKKGIQKILSDYDNGSFLKTLNLYIDMFSSGNVDEKSIIDFYNTYFDILKTISTDSIPDLQGDNVMLRGKTPVIIDPIADQKSILLSLDALGKTL